MDFDPLRFCEIQEKNLLRSILIKMPVVTEHEVCWHGWKGGPGSFCCGAYGAGELVCQMAERWGGENLRVEHPGGRLDVGEWLARFAIHNARSLRASLDLEGWNLPPGEGVLSHDPFYCAPDSSWRRHWQAAWGVLKREPVRAAVERHLADMGLSWEWMLETIALDWQAQRGDNRTWAKILERGTYHQAYNAVWTGLDYAALVADAAIARDVIAQICYLVRALFAVPEVSVTGVDGQLMGCHSTASDREGFPTPFNEHTSWPWYWSLWSKVLRRLYLHPLCDEETRIAIAGFHLRMAPWANCFEHSRLPVTRAIEGSVAYVRNGFFHGGKRPTIDPTDSLYRLADNDGNIMPWQEWWDLDSDTGFIPPLPVKALEPDGRYFAPFCATSGRRRRHHPRRELVYRSEGKVFQNATGPWVDEDTRWSQPPGLQLEWPGPGLGFGDLEWNASLLEPDAERATHLRLSAMRKVLDARMFAHFQYLPRRELGFKRRQRVLDPYGTALGVNRGLWFLIQTGSDLLGDLFAAGVEEQAPCEDARIGGSEEAAKVLELLHMHPFDGLGRQAAKGGAA